MMEPKDHLQLSTDYSLAGLKGAFAANGGAIVGLLTFVGNRAVVVEPQTLWWAFVWFSLGIGGALLAYLAGFLAQAAHMNGEAAYKKGGSFAVLGLVAAGTSILLFIVGAFVALDAIT
jgi:hypothetical protein